MCEAMKQVFVGEILANCRSVLAVSRGNDNSHSTHSEGFKPKLVERGEKEQVVSVCVLVSS